MLIRPELVAELTFNWGSYAAWVLIRKMHSNKTQVTTPETPSGKLWGTDYQYPRPGGTWSSRGVKWSLELIAELATVAVKNIRAWANRSALGRLDLFLWYYNINQDSDDILLSQTNKSFCDFMQHSHTHLNLKNVHLWYFKTADWTGRLI